MKKELLIYFLRENNMTDKQAKLEIKKGMGLMADAFNDLLNEMILERIIDEKIAGHMRTKFLSNLSTKIKLLIPSNKKEN